VTSVGSRGDSYDNALAESVIGLYKTELVARCGPWAASRTLNSGLSDGSTGFTIAGFTAASATNRLQSTRPASIVRPVPVATGTQAPESP
jgi:transposase InsO family protein